MATRSEPTMQEQQAVTLPDARLFIDGELRDAEGGRTYEDAIKIANDSQYGRSGGVVSADEKRPMRRARRIRSGSVSVDSGLCIAGDIPSGGYKANGAGREWSLEGIEEFLETQLIAVAKAA